MSNSSKRVENSNYVCLDTHAGHSRVSTVSWMGMNPTGRVSLMSINFMSTRTLPKWLWRSRSRRKTQHKWLEFSLELAGALAFWQHEPTYVFFGEDPGEAQVTGHLGFEKSVFPQIRIQTVGSYSDLNVQRKEKVTELGQVSLSRAEVVNRVAIFRVGSPIFIHLQQRANNHQDIKLLIGLHMLKAWTDHTFCYVSYDFSRGFWLTFKWIGLVSVGRATVLSGVQGLTTS